MGISLSSHLAIGLILDGCISVCEFRLCNRQFQEFVIATRWVVSRPGPREVTFGRHAVAFVVCICLFSIDFRNAQGRLLTPSFAPSIRIIHRCGFHGGAIPAFVAKRHATRHGQFGRHTCVNRALFAITRFIRTI